MLNRIHACLESHLAASFTVFLCVVFLCVHLSGHAEEPTWRKGLERGSQATLDMKISKQQIETVITMFAGATKKAIILGEGVKGREVTAFFQNTPFDKALRSFAAAHGFCVVEDEECILLVTRQEFMAHFAKTLILPVKNADPEVLAAAIEGFQKTLREALITVSVEPRTRSLILRGDPEQVESLRRIAQELDESMPRYGHAEILLLKHANPEALANILKGGGVGKGGEGVPKISPVNISFDSRTRALILTGDPEQIEIIKSTARQLDESLATEVFNVRFASVNSIARAIKEALRISEQSIGSVVVDERTNRLIINEIPENLEVCKRIIASLDIPVETRVFSTGMIDPKLIAEQIRKGELGGGDKEKGRPASETNVQVVEGTSQIIVTDTVERLIILEKVMEELNRNIETRVVMPHNATPDEIAGVLKTSFPDVPVSTDPRTGSLVITAHRDRIDQINSLISQLDAKENVQVEIEAKIMLVSSDKLKQVGLRIYGHDLDGFNETLMDATINPNFLADSPKNIGSPLGNPPGGPITNPLKDTRNYLEVLQPNIHAQAIVRALESDGDTKILSNPKLRMLMGKPSVIFSGSNEPYRETTFQNEQAVENVKFIDVGVTLQVIAFVSPSDILTLDVQTEFSNLREVRDGIPVIDTRRVQTTAEARNGETIFLGGLITQEEGSIWSGIPILRSIPLLGYLFGEKKQSAIERELLIVLRPIIMSRDNAQLEISEGEERIPQQFSIPSTPGKEE